MDRSAQTALGSARARFVEGLPRRARELHEAVEHLGSARGDPQVHEEMRRRLHALYATAQVFEEDGLAHAVKDVIAWLDAARDAGRNLDAAGLARLRAFAERLPDYVSDELAQRPSRAQPVADAAEARCAAGSASLPPAQPSAAAVEPDADRPSAITRSVSGFVSTPAVTGVLVVDSAPMRARLRQILPEDQFEVWGTDDAEEAIRLLHVDSPDFAFVSGELAALPGVDLVRRLQTDPLSNVRAVYMLLPEGASYDAQFLRQTGADGVLIAPFDEAAVVALVRARTHFVRRAFGALSTLTHGTADDVAARVADEIRRGIADSLQAGRSEKIHFDDASELMAAAWSAIGRVRAHLVEHSRGRIRFRADALGDAPALLALGEQSVAPEPDAQLGSVLQGRRVLVADDDPAVLWFFAGLLREAGAQVLEATDGRQALELARLKRPDVVVSDILMPKIDGFALCREIKRDAMLWHMPVILLSWKEDFLQRMRELDAGASGYLRKEAGSRQILAGLADVLRPRARLEEQLRAGDEVRGRVEGLGMLPLLETATAQRPNVRVTVRDAWNLFEVDIRAGKALAVTRTASDGTFARGDHALLQLLGVSSGRFAIEDSEAPLRAPLPEPLDRALQTAGKRLAALLDAVSDARLMQVARVAFDDTVVASLLSSTPTPLAEVVARLREGGTNARELLLDGTFSPGDLAEYLRELARRGAVAGVWDAQGEDLVAIAAAERDERPGTLLQAASAARSSQAPGTARPSGAPARGAGDAALAALFAQDGVDALASVASPAIPEVAAERAAATLEVEPTLAREPQITADPDDDAPLLGQLPTLPPGASEGRDGLAMLLTAAALMLVGYFGWQQLERAQRTRGSYAVAEQPAGVRSSSPSVGPPPAAQPSSLTAPPASAGPDQPSSSDASGFGRVLPYVDKARGVEVRGDQGLFVVDFEGAGPPPSISDGEHELGRPPLTLALSAGRHELRLRRGDELSVRYVFIKPGQTRWVTLSAAGD